MAIEKKLICFARLEEFERQLAAGNILDYSIVFIQDAKKIWNRGTYYDCSGSSDAAVYGDGYIESQAMEDGTYLTTNVAENLDAVSARGQLADAYDVKTFVADAIPSNVSELNNDSSYTPYDQVVSMLSSYVKKETGKGLSTQDFTTELEGKLKGIEANAQKNVQSDWNESDTDSDAYVNNRTHYSYDMEQVTSFSIASKNEGDILVTGLQDGVFYRIINNAGGKNEAFHFVEGRKVVIPSNGPTIEAVCAYEDDYCLKLTTPTYGMTESFVLKEVYVEQLDDVYIPETIARKAEIATINGQSLTEGGDITIEGESLTESDIAAMGFTKNTGTYSKPSGGIPKSDLTSAVQTSLGKADTALQSYTEQYKGTITGVSANGTSVATSGVANIPAASTSAYGVTKLSSATNSTSTTLAATASAVKAAYDLANSYKGTVTGVKINGTTKSPSSGVVDLGTVITSHQTLKTINGQSIVGSGDLTISGGGSYDDSEIREAISQLSAITDDFNSDIANLYNVKQDTLESGTNIKTINGQSILGSGNISISGGSGGGSSAYSEVNHGTSDTTFTLTPNTFHVWDEVSALTLTLGSETAGVANEYLFQFTSGASATTLSLPSDLKWVNDTAPAIIENMIYQVSILKGLASVLEFSNAAPVVLISFTIAGTSYQAEDGMDWNDWCDSKYNTNGYHPSSSNVYNSTNSYVVSYNNAWVKLTDVIVNNGTYVHYYVGGGAGD